MLKFSASGVVIQFTNLIEEYNAAHTESGLFDVSQKGILLLKGERVKDKLQAFVPTDLNRIGVGESCHTVLLNERGTIRNTITIHDLGQNTGYSEIIIIVDQIYMPAQIDWIFKQLKLSDIIVTDLRKTHILLALEGPMAEIHLNEVTRNSLITNMPPLTNCILRLNGIHTGFAAYAPLFITRASYIGNYGFQMLLQSHAAISLWKNLILKGIKPCGLATWDILRLENLLPIYGCEIDSITSPFEASLSRLIHLEIPKHFTARQCLEAQSASNTYYCLCVLTVETLMVPNQNCFILFNKNIVGRITSSGWSTTLAQPIVFGYIPSEIAECNKNISISMYNQIYLARVLKVPFFE